MNREEFEKTYADKYTSGDVSAVRDNRDGEGYTDHHINMLWNAEQCANWIIGSGGRVKRFCWIPTKVYKVKYFRSGFRWLSYAWLDKDGLFYETETPLAIDFERIKNGRKNNQNH